MVSGPAGVGSVENKPPLRKTSKAAIILAGHLERLVIVRRLAPHSRLAGIVRHYQARTADPGEPSRRVALPARTDVLMEFYFTAPHLLELQATRTLERAPLVAAVGPQTFRRIDLILSGRMDIFTIHFTPTGLHLLSGVPMTELTDAGPDAAALFRGRTIDDLHGRLAEASDFISRARFADAFILAQLAGRPRPGPGRIIAGALARLGRSAGSDPARTLATEAGLSDRQFRRIFVQQVGVAPKKYARIVRLEAALALRTAMPDRTWTDIAHECGWFDQPHMDKDFVALTGGPPSLFVPTTQTG